MVETKKNLSIETLRGIAILLVVVGHVIGSGPSGGMKIDFPHPLRYLYLWIDYIQMPLFTSIAGWVYALKPFSATADFNTFVKKKALRLLVPMATVSTLYFLIQYFMPGTNNKGELSGIWRIYIFPYTIYWYLPSLFLIFVMQWWIDKWKGMNSTIQWILCLFVALLMCHMERYIIPKAVPNFFSFKGALNQLPYFIIGIGVQRFSTIIYRRINQYVYVICTLIGMVMLQYEWFGCMSGVLWYELLQPVWVLASLLLLLHLQWENRFFSWLGSYAYTIYLFHGFGTSGGRIILKMIGINAIIPIFLLVTVIAVACPILLERLLNRFKILRIGLLGK